MTNTTEALLADLSHKLGELTSAYVKLEVTSRTEMKAMREDLADLRSSIRDVARAQADHGERLTASEIRISAMQEDRVTVEKLNTRVSVLETTVEHHAPVRTPWTAIVSAVVAISALAWSLFGR